MAAASNNAILNVGRLNAFRLNYVAPALRLPRETTTTVTLNNAPVRVRLGSMTIRDIINDAPNTCTFVADHATPPTVGNRLRVTLGVDPKYLLFAGPLQHANETYVGTPAVRAWQCEAIDDTKRADWLRPFGAWENVSATTVAQQLVAGFAPGFTSVHVQAGLPSVTVYLDGTERMNGALTLLAKLIGGYFYWEDFDLHLFTGEEAGRVDPDDITPTSRQLLDDPAVTYDQDDAQIRTRCYGQGHAEMTLAPVAAGATVIPIANTVMFSPSGGRAISEWQRLQYTGLVPGGTGALVGPGVTPTSAPTLALATGSGLGSGTYRYAYSWVTASGETPASPIATMATGSIASPTVAPTLINQGGPGGGYGVAGDPLASAVWKPGDTVDFGYSYSTAASNSAIVPATPISPLLTVVAQAASSYFHAPGDTAKSVWLSIPHSPDTRVTFIPMWHRINGGPWYWWQGVVNHPEWVAYGSVTQREMSSANVYAASGASPSPTPLVLNQIALSGIAVGPAAVTSRKVYRSIADGTTVKLLATLANNSATTYADAAADGALGATAPSSDTSGLQSPAGTVPAGSASMVVASTAWTVSGGGWATIGNGDQVIRYTGTSGNTITGIPASGPGAIVAPVNYNSTITGAPMLTGVTGITAAIREGAPVNLWVQVDDTVAQAELATRTGGSGIIENLIIDERRGLPSLQAICTADLAMYSRPAVAVVFTSTDPKTRSGGMVRLALPSLSLDQTLRIQDVTISQLGLHNVRPRFASNAGSLKTSLEDLLRRMVGTLEEGF